ncbi:MAG: peptidylprolyl isomerase [Bacteroidetes bacterium]|uniref:Peptidyl-prolyl cis-trans isomerase n=1 Tax=Candidatus Cryptobacteroides intestinigallinarum TaxID=2840767 RepID=A0A9D9HJB6_9BACT|nr:peptidylprolyl isomerase [Candidatus Cryptobacteroides intestinigallinarum]
MKIEDNKVVELCYELEVDGEIVDRTTKERPLDYIHGTRSLLDKFEENIAGLEPGSTFEFTLAPDQAYGEIDPDRIIDLPMQAFEVNGEVQKNLLVPGATIPMLNGRGNVVPGKVLEVNETTVKMDLNSPMAGKTLNFKGEILTVRDATEKELKEGLHGEYVHSCCCGGHDEGHGCHGGSCHEGGCHGEGHNDGGCCGGHGDHEGGCCGEGHGHHDGGCCGKCDE